MSPNDSPTTVLVHGAFADASGFAGIIRELESRGYPAVAPPNPLRSLSFDADSVAAFVRALDRPVVLVGHSYGGAVITQASAGLDNVVALVYLAAFGLDEGESAGSVAEDYERTLLASTAAPTSYEAAGAPGGPELYIGKEQFRETFGADVPVDLADVMWATQRPLSIAALTEPATMVGWKTKPSWYMVAEQDRCIDPDLQRHFAERMGASTESVAGSHTAFISQPKLHADFIERALTAG